MVFDTFCITLCEENCDTDVIKIANNNHATTELNHQLDYNFMFIQMKLASIPMYTKLL